MTKDFLLLFLVLIAGCNENPLAPTGTKVDDNFRAGEPAANTPINTAPSMLPLANSFATAAATATTPLAITIGDAESSLDCSTSLSIVSSNPSLIDNSDVVWGGTSPNCTAILTPNVGQTGKATIQFIVSDGSLTASQTSALYVGTPVIGPVIDRMLAFNANLSLDVPIPIAGADGISCSEYLRVTSVALPVASAGDVSLSGVTPNCEAQASIAAGTFASGSISVEAGMGGLTDTYTFSLTTLPMPEVAFGLRKVVASYLGGALRIRRSSDNAQLDIGFQDNGNMDSSALLSFCAATSCFVHTWFDQSGNGRDVVQSINADQPRIVNNGTLETINGWAGVRFLGNGANKLCSAGFTAFTSGWTSSSVAKVDVDSTYNALVTKTSSNMPRPFDQYNNSFLIGSSGIFNVSSMLTGFFAATPLSVWTFVIPTSGTALAFHNGVPNGSLSGYSYGDDGNPLCLAGRNDNVTSLNGWIIEVLVYGRNFSSSERVNLENGQMNYFNLP